MAIARVSRRLSVPLALALALALLAGVAPAPVRAASHAVTVTMNDANSPGGDSDVLHACDLSGTGPCSLRDAVVFAFNQPAADTTTITLPAGTYTLRRPGNNEDFGSDGDLDLHNTTVINGAGAGATIVQASPTGGATAIDRVFEVGAINGGTATISGVTIRYGGNTADGMGGGIAVRGGASLTLNNCVISDNTASGDGGGLYVASGATLAMNHTTVSANNGPSGGGIFSAGTLTVTNSTVTGNMADRFGAAWGGGGIYNSSGAVTVIDSTIAANHADGGGGGGGGIYNNGGSASVTNSTIAGNTADGTSSVGGGIIILNSVASGGALTVINSTISGNTTDGTNGTGGGIYTPSGIGTLTAINTLIAGNSATGSGGTDSDVRGAFAAGSKNTLLGDGGGATGIANGSNGNLVGTTPHPINPLLDATLRDNGAITGTQTLALLSVLSPANNAGDDATCANMAGPAPVGGKDQRGITRPQPAGGHCDIGAYELIAATAVALAAGPNPSPVGQAVTFTATVSGSGGTPTGSVTFKDGATTLGTGTLAGGGATFSTAALTQGSHPITAVYGGDSIFAPSTSAVLTQVVTTATPTGIAVTATATTIPVGGADQFTATCTYSSGPPSDCTASVTWTSDTPSVATVDAAGLVTGVAAGTAKITATVGAVTGGANVAVTGGGPPPASGLQFYPLAKPVRLLDTRKGATAFVAPGAPLTAGQTLALPGRFAYNGVAIPDAAQAIVGNATVANGANGTPAGFATIFPSGVPLPLASNLNFVPGTVRPNAFTVALGADGKFDLYSSSGGDFVVDISGYYAPVGTGGLYFHPLSAPVRELDTRSGATAFVHPDATLTAGQTLNLPGSFAFNGVTVPAGAKALVGNATVANGSNGTPAGFATLYPNGVPLPLASNLNFVPGTVAPNAFTTALGGDGTYNLYSSTGGDFVVDITGYLDTTAAGGLLFTPLSAPVRELDTRSGATAFVHPDATLAAGQTLTLPGAFTYNGIAIPAGAQALVGNATVANDGNGTPAGYATLYPDGVPLPLASNLNFVPKQVAPNAIAVGVGADGKYDLYSSSGGDFVIDITGYFAAPGAAGAPAKTPATKPTG